MNSFLREKNRGLTVVEVLIVIVIVAILAALVVPRLMMQPEQRVVSEAQTFLNTIREAQINLKNATGSITWRDAASYEQSKSPDPGWTALGLAPLAAGAPFRYECQADSGTCTAARLGTAGDPKFKGTITIDLGSGNFSCGAPYAVAGGNGAQVVCD